MKFNFLLIFIVGLFSSYGHLFSSEVSKDIYWEKVVKSFDGKQDFVEQLKKKEKNIYGQLEQIKNDQSLISMWGLSQNFDAGAKQIILDEKIIGDLQGVFNDFFI